MPPEAEHIYPDYGLYGISDTAYGFLTRGCPRGCDFCIVKDKEGRRSHKVADLEEFWHGQKNIVLLDPNMFACKDWKDLADQLIQSKALVDFSQGVDIRIMTEEMAETIKRIRVKMIHFAWDRYEDKDIVLPKLEMFAKVTKWYRQKMCVYVLVNFNSTYSQDLERVYTLRDMGYAPFVMVYNKDKTTMNDNCRKLQRYVNNRRIFYTIDRIEEYDRNAVQKL